MFPVGRFWHTLRGVELLNLPCEPREPFKPCIAVQAPLFLNPRQHFRMRKFDESSVDIVDEMKIQISAMHKSSERFPGCSQRDNILPTFAVMLFVLFRRGDVRLTRHGDDGGDEVWILQVPRENKRTLTFSTRLHFLDLVPRVNRGTEDGGQSENFSIGCRRFQIHWML